VRFLPCYVRILTLKGKNRLKNKEEVLNIDLILLSLRDIHFLTVGVDHIFTPIIDFYSPTCEFSSYGFDRCIYEKLRPSSEKNEVIVQSIKQRLR